MEEIFKQYGGPIITVMVIVGIIALVALLLATEGEGGVIHKAFNGLITKFQKSGEDAIGGTGGTIIFNHFFR